jgi:hypothetical protein
MTQHARPLVSSAASLGYALRAAPAGDDMRSAPRRLALVLMLALGAAACGSDSTAPGNPGITGTFELQTVNGVALPIVYPPFGRKQLDSQTLRSYGRDFTIQRVESDLYEGVVYWTNTWHDTGHVAVKGSTLTFWYNTTRWSPAITGTLSGDTLTLTYDYSAIGGDDWIYVYMKQ